MKEAIVLKGRGFNMRFFITSLCSVVTSFFLCSIIAQAQTPTRLVIGTGGTGGTYYPVGKSIAQAISEKSATDCQFSSGCGVQGLQVEAISTAASAYNITQVQAEKLDMGISDAAILYFAYNGLYSFAGKKKQDLRILGNLYSEDMHLILAEGVELAALTDLAGKRVGIAKTGSGTQIAVESILKEFNLTRSDYTATEAGNAESAQLMSKGQLDAYFYVAGTPISAINELIKNSKATLYSFREYEIRRISKLLPYYTPSIITADVYHTQENINTLGVSAMLVAHAKQPDELVYNIVKALWSNHGVQTILNGHRKGSAITLDSSLNGLEGLSVPLHPGAEKFYKRVCLFMVPRSPERYKRYPIECAVK